MAPTRAQESLQAAIRLNPSEMEAIPTGKIAQTLLAPDETVLRIIACERTGDWFPVLIATDRRIVHAREATLTPWTPIREVPSGAVTGARFRRGLIAGKVIVDVRGAKPLTVPALSQDSGEAFAALVDNLVRRGAHA